MVPAISTFPRRHEVCCISKVMKVNYRNIYVVKFSGNSSTVSGRSRSALMGLTLPRDSFHIRFFANVLRYIAKVTRLFAILSATKMKVIGFLYYTCSFIFNFKRAPWPWPLLDCVDLLWKKISIQMYTCRKLPKFIR